MNLLLKISIILVFGIIGGKIAKYFKLPSVTGYLLAGVLIGPSILKFVGPEDVTSFAIINDMALAGIAFSIGNEFLIKDIKKLGKNIIYITLSQVFGAILVVFIVTFFIFKQSFVFSLVIASMSAATAPAATIMVIRQFKADGPLTRTILPVVALDDAIGIILFGLAMSIARISLGDVGSSYFYMIIKPFLEIIGSALVGFIIGTILAFVAKRAKDQEELLIISLLAIALSTGIANQIGISPLLTCMVMGATLVNLKPKSRRVFTLVNGFTPPIYLIFFTLAGAGLDLSILSKVGFLGVGYVLARALGKILGAYIGAKAVKADEAVVKYLGMSLLPQGGISIGLSMVVAKYLPDFSQTITTVILFSVLIYEATGPIFAKIAITKAKEVGQLGKKTKDKLEKEVEIA